MFRVNERELALTLLCGGEALNREISSSNINRPGLALCGFLDNFRSDVIQVMGRGEYSYCQQLSPEELEKNLKKMAATGMPCVIITYGHKDLPVLQKVCEEASIPLFSTEMETAVFVGELGAYLEARISPTTHLHGVLVDVSGLGVLITGEPGIGKSECALELIKRGHIFVADDVIEVQRRRGNAVMGMCPAMLRYYMEVRGLGIIDVEQLFGVGAVREDTKIEMVVDLTHPSKANLDRVGLDMPAINVLGVDLPLLSIPVTPGRNLAVLIEVAALNQQLRNKGVFSAEEFSKRVLDKIQNDKTGKK